VQERELIMGRRIFEFDHYYDSEGDVLSVFDPKNSPSETIEFSDILNIDISKEGAVVGLEIFSASKFFEALNNGINKEFLKELTGAKIKWVDFRNNWFVMVLLESNQKEISQNLPLLCKQDYISPLIASC